MIRDSSILNKVIVARNHHHCSIVGIVSVVSAWSDSFDPQYWFNGNERVGRGSHWQVV